MQYLLLWLGITLLFLLVINSLWKSKAKTPAEKTQQGAVQKENIYEGLDNVQLLETVAKNIGCTVTKVEGETARFDVLYQGEHFLVGCALDNPYMNIYDVAWYSVPADDIEHFSMVRQATNTCNLENLSTVLYTIDEENNTVNVHTRQCLVFGAFMPDVEGFFRSRLEDSFQQHHRFFRLLEELKKEQ